MTRRRFFIGLAIASIVVIAAWLLGFAAHATAETLNFKMFNHMTKAEKRSPLLMSEDTSSACQ